MLITCHAGCGAVDVLASIGLGLRDLFPGGPLGQYIPSKRKKYREPEAEYGIPGARRLKQNLDQAKDEIRKLRGRR